MGQSVSGKFSTTKVKKVLDLIKEEPRGPLAQCKRADTPLQPHAFPSSRFARVARHIVSGIVGSAYSVLLVCPLVYASSVRASTGS